MNSTDEGREIASSNEQPTNAVLQIDQHSERNSNSTTGSKRHSRNADLWIRLTLDGITIAMRWDNPKKIHSRNCPREDWCPKWTHRTDQQWKKAVWLIKRREGGKNCDVSPDLAKSESGIESNSLPNSNTRYSSPAASDRLKYSGSFRGRMIWCHCRPSLK
jgi:hypothetical protein